VSVYLDSSVVLRVVLNAPDQLREWRSLAGPIASALLEVECFRTIERLRGTHGPADAIDLRRREITSILSLVHLIDITPPLLRRAAQSFPFPLKTLDAIHLAAAIAWRERFGPLVFATHDLQLARAARELGFDVVGA
jgi:predicted nucleic acid-binding protein